MSWIFIVVGLLIILPGHHSRLYHDPYSDDVPLTRREKELLEEILRETNLADKYAKLGKQTENNDKYNKNENLSRKLNRDQNNNKDQTDNSDQNVDQTNYLVKEPNVNLEVKDNGSPMTTTPVQALNKSTTHDTAPLPPQRHKQDQNMPHRRTAYLGSDLVFMGIVAACSIAGLIGLIMAGVCWYKLHKNVKAASEVEYPAYGVTGPTKERMAPIPGDRKLAQSAQMYHYQHQKQQMIAMEKANGEMKHDASEDESEEENEEGDYTVYECPGLAPTGEMEVRNPLFNEETPSASGPEENKDTH